MYLTDIKYLCSIYMDIIEQSKDNKIKCRWCDDSDTPNISFETNNAGVIRIYFPRPHSGDSTYFVCDICKGMPLVKSIPVGFLEDPRVQEILHSFEILEK